MTYRVSMARHAQEDRERAFDWYSANYSQEYALKWFSGISEAIASLSINPQRCAKAIEDDRFPFDLYELAYGTRRNKHRILFTIRNSVVFIVRIRHSAQQDLGEDEP